MNPNALLRRLCVSLLAGFTLGLSLLTWTAPRLGAQAGSTGTVSGQASDRQGAAIEGANVVLTDTTTNSLQSTTTNEAGRYIFLNIAPGVYNLSLSKEGFSQARLTAQTVAVGLVRTLDVTLEVGSTATSIDVKASVGAELQTHAP